LKHHGAGHARRRGAGPLSKWPSRPPQKKTRPAFAGRGRRVHKPGSVARVSCLARAGGHSSGTRVTARLEQPTQELGRAALERSSTWPCSRWGLPCRDRYRSRGGLLLHRFTLTRPDRSGQAVCFSVALSSRSPSPGVTRHLALWSPDFPPGAQSAERSPEPLRPAESSTARSPGDRWLTPRSRA
jgi:hypothetical protein